MDNAFILYTSYYEILSDLNDEQMGKLFRAILEYKTTKKQPVVSVDLNVVFKFIKNQLDLDEKKYLEKSQKQSSNGKKGGAPKGNQNAKKQPKTTQNNPNKHNDKDNDNDKDKDNDNVFINEVVFEKEKKLDPFFDNPVIKKFQDEYHKHFNCKAFLTSQQRQKIMELNADIPDFIDVIPEAIERLKKLDFKDLPNFTPTANWLLKDNNLTALLNGAYEEKKSEFDKYFEQMEAR